MDRAATWAACRNITCPICVKVHRKLFWLYALMLCKIRITLSLSLSLSGYIYIYMYSRFEDTYTHTYITHICICTGILKIDIHLQTEKEVDENLKWCRKPYRPIDITIRFEIICNPSLCWYFCRQRKCRHACSKTKVRNYPGMLRCRFHKKRCCISSVWSDMMGYAVKSYHEIW